MVQGTIGQQILLNQTVVSSGSSFYENDANQQLVLFWNITGPVTGTTPTIQFTIQELDPSDQVTHVGQTVTSSVVTTTGSGQIVLTSPTSPYVLISWTVAGTTPSFGGTNLASVSRSISNSVAVTQVTGSNLNAVVVGTTAAGSGASTGLITIQGNASGTPIPITGSITATNPSVGTTATAVPTSATFIGGEVQTLQSGLTTGDLYPVSLTTAGLLRIDGSNVTQPVSGTVTANQGTANTLANAWTTQLTDGTNGPVAVKAASTSAAATDHALVVSQTPNLPLTNTVSSANINASTNGNNTLIAGVGGKTIRVFKVALVFSVGGTVIFQDGASTALSGPFILNAGATIVLDMDITNPWFLTSSGNAFVINLASGAVVGGVIYYTQS